MRDAKYKIPQRSIFDLNHWPVHVYFMLLWAVGGAYGLRRYGFSRADTVHNMLYRAQSGHANGNSRLCLCFACQWSLNIYVLWCYSGIGFREYIYLVMGV
jgi:hypothetical protein